MSYYRVAEYDSLVPTIIFFIIITVLTIYYIKKGKVKISGLITSLLLTGIIFFGSIYALFYMSKLFGEESLIYTFPIFIFLLGGVGYYIYKEKDSKGPKEFFENRNK